MITRRNFLNFGARAGLASATAPLWLNLTASRAFAQVSGSYKAIVLVTLPGGNDGNNTVIPLDSDLYAQYRSLRPSIAIDGSQCHVLNSSTGAPTLGLHPSLANVAALYNQGTAAIVANVGPLQAPATKQQIQANPDLVPASLLSHPMGIAQWESASASGSPSTGWGGRMADLLTAQSGTLPPLLDAGPASIFTVGRTVQAVALQANTGTFVALPAGLDDAVLAIAKIDASSANQIVAQAAQLRVVATKEQVILAQAQSSGATLRTAFPPSRFGNALKAIAQVINGRSVTGASRQIFYCNQGSYDFHNAQLDPHRDNLVELDQALAAFMQAMAEMGLSNEVLLCTHSDFSRTMQANATGGTDHAWGNHQILLGGGIRGGRIYGTMPTLELGGPSDYTSQGIWIPTTSVTQMTAGIGSWMGLNSTQLSSVFPDLANFPGGGLTLT